MKRKQQSVPQKGRKKLKKDDESLSSQDIEDESSSMFLFITLLSLNYYINSQFSRTYF